jgi:hypothetical protein
MMQHRIAQGFNLLALLGLAIGMGACSTLARKNDTGVVVAKRAQIRSSTAVVAADLLEISRGDTVDVLDTTTVQETGERWLLVRARNEDSTEGWIEARNVLPNSVLEQSKQLAEKDKDIPSQATGQLRASANLRMTPDRSGNDNIILKLDSGASFEIVGWQRTPKPKSSDTTESDDAPKAGAPQQSAKNRQTEAPKGPEESNELWYRVRLQRVMSPAPEGWVFGKQVELTVPSDIIFYRTGREFVAWQRLDDDSATRPASASNRTTGQEQKPGSWVILEKSSSNEPKKADEPEFDRIYVLGYDKSSQEHYTAFRSGDLKGYLPLRVENVAGSKSFSVRVRDQSGQIVDAKYNVTRDDRGNLKVTSASDQNKDKRRR